MSLPAVTRLINLDDPPELARLVADNRVEFAPWEPLRDPAFYTVDGQRDVIASVLDRHDFGSLFRT